MAHLGRTLTLALLFLVTPVASRALAAGEGRAAAPSPVTRTAAVRAYVGVYLLGIRHLDVASGTFEADFNLWVRWRSTAELDLSSLTVVNGTLSYAEETETPAKESGPWRRRLWRMTGGFRDAFPLQNFPFDRHTLSIAVAHPALSARDLTLEPDVEGSGVAPGLDIPGWTSERQFGSHKDTVPYSARFGRDSGERSVVFFKVYIERPVMSLLTKILVPLILVLCMSHGAFWCAPAEAATRLMLSSTAIFAAIGVHFMLAGTLPDVNYLTIADIYFILVYIFLLIELAAAIVSHVLVLKGWPRAVVRLDHAVRWAAPCIFLGCAAASSWTAAQETILGRREALPPMKSTSPELAIGTLRDPTALGWAATAVIEKFLTRLVLAPLVELDEKGGPRALMAESVPTYKNDTLRIGDDETTHVHWTLRRGARWGDGSAVSFADVLLPDAARPTFRGAREVRPSEASDLELDVEYNGVRPNVIYDAFLFPKSQRDRTQREGPNPDALERAMTLELPPLSGPFILKESKPGSHVLFERNPNNLPHLRPSALERVVVRFFKSRDELKSAFRDGKIQMILPGDLFIDDATALAEEVRGAAALLFDAPEVWLLDMNLDDPVLKDRRVRQALLQGLDRKAIIDDVLKGHGRVADSWLPPHHPAIAANIRRYFHNPKRANELLDEAGLPRGPDGRRRDRSGRPLHFKISRAEPHPPTMVDLIKRFWGALGIEVEDDPVEYKHYMGDYTDRLQWPHFAFLAYNILPYETGVPYWLEAKIPTAQNGGWNRGYRNYSRWREPRMNEIYDKLRQTIIAEDAVDLLARQQQIWADELPVLPLYTRQQAVLVRSGLEGVQPHPVGEAFLGWNAEEWRFGGKKQLKTQ